jgi:hypothetical protein
MIPRRHAGDRDGHARPVDRWYLRNNPQREDACATAANFDWPRALRWRQ